MAEAVSIAMPPVYENTYTFEIGPIQITVGRNPMITPGTVTVALLPEFLQGGSERMRLLVVHNEPELTPTVAAVAVGQFLEARRHDGKG